MQFGKGRRYGFGKLRGGASSTPLTIANDLLLWSKFQNTDRSLWNTSGYQYNNEASGLPDAKAFSGGAVSITPANGDFIDSEVTWGSGTTSCEVLMYVSQFYDANQYLLTSDNINDVAINVDTSGFGRLLGRVGGSSGVAITDITTKAPNGGYIHLTWDSVTISMSVYNPQGILIETQTNSNSNTFTGSLNIRIATNVGSASNFYVKDIYVRKNPPSFNLTNVIANPNSFVETAQGDSYALFAYDCNQGLVDTDYPLIDVSTAGNHGRTRGASITSVKTADVGSQTVTHGWSKYDYVSGTGTVSTLGTALTGSGTSFTTELAVGDLIWASNELVQIASITDNTNAVLETAPDTDFSGDSFTILDQDEGSTDFLVPAVSPKATTDIFGNTVQSVWSEEILNWAFAESYLQIGSGTITDFDTTAKTFVNLIEYSANSLTQELFSNRDTGSGQSININGSTNVYSFVNETNGAVETTLNRTGNLSDGSTYVIDVVCESGGTSTHFGDVVDMATAEVNNGSTGSLGDSSDITTIGLNIEKPQIPLIYGKALAISELEALRVYLKKKFNPNLVFSASSIKDLQFWFDGTDSSSQSFNDNLNKSVSSQIEKSTNALTIEPDTSTRFNEDNYWNNGEAAWFSSAGDVRVKSNKTAFKFLHDSTGFVLFALVKPTKETYSSSTPIFSTGGAIGVELLHNTSLIPEFKTYGASVDANAVSDTALVYDTYVVLRVQYDLTNVKMFIDGTEVASAAHSGGSSSDHSEDLIMNFPDMEVKHFIMYDRILPDVQINGIEDWLDAEKTQTVSLSDYNTYVIAGQSNATGQSDNANVDASLTGNITGAYIFNVDGEGDFGYIDYPSTSTDVNQINADRHGFWLKFSKDMSAVTTPYFMVLGQGGTNLRVDWKVPSGTEYVDYGNGWVRGLDHLKNVLKKTPKIRGFVWMQGESDGQSLASASFYQGELENLIKQVADDFTDAGYDTSDMRVTILRIRDQWAVYKEPQITDIRAAQDYVGANFLTDFPAYASKVKSTQTLSTDTRELKADDVHYSAQGNFDIGEQLAAYYDDYISE